MENENISSLINNNNNNNTFQAADENWRQRFNFPNSLMIENSTLYISAIVFISLWSIPLNLFIIIQILRYRIRWTTVNFLILWSRILSIASLLHIPCSLYNNGYLCSWTYIIFPGIILFEKLQCSFIAIIRYLFIFCDKCVRSCCCSFLHDISIASIVICLNYLITMVPFSTYSSEEIPTYATCRDGIIHLERISSYVFLFIYFIIITNSFILDVLCYTRILNYMRHNAIDAVTMTIPSSYNETHLPQQSSNANNNLRRKNKNIITGASNFLLWLIYFVCCIPPCILLISVPINMHGRDTLVLLNYQLALIFVMNILLPGIIVGSSLDLRTDIYRIKRQIERKLWKNDNNINQIYFDNENVQQPTTYASNGIASTRSVNVYVLPNISQERHQN